MRKKKGQFTIIGIVLIFVALVILGALMPSIVSTIASAKNATGNDTTISLLFDIIPILFVVGIVLSILAYTVPQRKE